ncbi:MAG TPA: hypothetical protein VGE74_27305, partial [Gemmata sp.]
MRKLVAPVVVALAGLIASAEEPKAAGAKAGGWIDLMTPAVWKKVDARWAFADEVKLAPDAKGKADVRLKAEPRDGGKVWVNGETGRLPNLITKEAFGDCEVHVEFLIAKNSNAGIKFHEVY